MDSTKNIWLEIAQSLEIDDVNKIFELLDEWTEYGNPSIWQWDILVDDFNIFPQESVNYLFQITSGVKAVSREGAILSVPANIRTIASEVFEFIATVAGASVIKAFERAFRALQNDPSLTYDFWLNYRLGLGIGSDLDDLIVYAASFQNVYSLKPIYSIEGYIDTSAIVNNATLETPVYSGGSYKLFQRNYQKYATLQTQKRLQLEDSIDLFKMFGPLNRAVNNNLLSDSKCSIYGGCRMLLCDCYDKDWFLGYCEVCLRKIEYSGWALREPVLTGSWKGCFCSPGCLEYKLENYDGMLELYAFGVLWNEIKNNGIYYQK